MARFFRGSIYSDYLIHNAGCPTPDYPWTLSGWTRRYSVTGEQHAVLAIDGVAWRDAAEIVGTTIAGAEYNVWDGTEARMTPTGKMWVKWHHISASSAAAADHKAFLDGQGKATSTQSVTGHTMSQITIGARGSGGSYYNYLFGLVAECAIWDIELGDDEHLLLGQGWSPLRIRPDHLRAYWPLRYNDLDHVGNYHMSPVNGPTWLADHPPILEAPKLYQIPFDYEAAPAEGISIPFLHLAKQTIGPPNFDGLLQVNWNHPVANGLTFLCASYGKHLSQPINLVTGEQGVPSSTEKMIALRSGWGESAGGNLGNAGRYDFYKITPTLEVSIGAIAVRVTDYASANDNWLLYYLDSDSGESFTYRPVSGYTGDRISANVMHDFSGAGSLGGPSPPSLVGEIFAGIMTYWHDGTNSHTDIGETDLSGGFRTATGLEVNPALDGAPDRVRLNPDMSQNTGAFLTYMWNRVLSYDEIEIVTNPQLMWDLLKPLPRHFYFPHEELTSLKWITNRKSFSILEPADGATGELDTWVAQRKPWWEAHGTIAAAVTSGLASMRAIARGILRGIGRGVG